MKNIKGILLAISISVGPIAAVATEARATDPWLGKWKTTGGSVLQIEKSKNGKTFAHGELNGGGTSVFALEKAELKITANRASVGFDGVEDTCQLKLELKANTIVIQKQADPQCFGRVSAEGTYTRVTN